MSHKDQNRNFRSSYDDNNRNDNRRNYRKENDRDYNEDHVHYGNFNYGRKNNEQNRDQRNYNKNDRQKQFGDQQQDNRNYKPYYNPDFNYNVNNQQQQDQYQERRDDRQNWERRQRGQQQDKRNYRPYYNPDFNYSKRDINSNVNRGGQSYQSDYPEQGSYDDYNRRNRGTNTFSNNNQRQDWNRRDDFNQMNYGGYHHQNDRNYNRDYDRDRDANSHHHHQNSRNNRDDRNWWDRTSDEVAAWFGDDEAERRRREDRMSGPHKGKGPRGYERSDERIRDDINDRFYDDSFIDATGIQVMVEKGVVTLEGDCESREEKRRAEDLAEKVSGVKSIENRLKVSKPVAVGSSKFYSNMNQNRRNR